MQRSKLITITNLASFFVRNSVTIFFTLIATACSMGDIKNYDGSMLRMSIPSISSDNNQLVFSYVGPGMGRRERIGAYDIEADSLIHIPLDYNYSWESPVFSPDMRYIALEKGCGLSCSEEIKGSWIAVIDTQEKTIAPKTLVDTPVYQSHPVFSPDGKWITFFEREFDVREDGAIFASTHEVLIKKMSLETGKTHVVYHEKYFPADLKNGFGSDIQYLSDNTLLVSMSGADNRRHFLHVIDGDNGILLENRKGYEWVAKLGDYPSIVGMETGQIAFAGVNKKYEPNAAESLRKGYDIYIKTPLHNGGFSETRRATHEMMYPAQFRFSNDGRSVVVNARGKGEKNHSIRIIKLDTGEVIRPDIKNRIAAKIKAKISD